jgi:hypothetical protein
MEFLYSLYDALIGIHVPSDKARAVVDAMERDMGTTLATKVDLKACATRDDIVAVRGEMQGLKPELAAVKQDIAAFKQDTRQEFVLVRQEIGALRQDLDARFTLLRQEIDSTRRLLSKDIEAMRSSIVIWLGSAIVVAAGVIFAAMRVS